jgi:hypothetical protein
MPDIRTEAHGLGEIGSGLIGPAAVKRKGDLDTLDERAPSLPRLERAGEGGVEDTQRGEAMALEVEAEGLEDQRRGVTWVERDGEVGLGDGRVDERAEGLGRRGARVGEELGALCEVPARLGRGVAAGAAKAEGDAAGEGVKCDEHARGEEEEDALDDGLRPGAGGAKRPGGHGSVSVAGCGWRVDDLRLQAM